VIAALALAALVGARVILVQAPAAGARSVETINRIRGEIAASGLEPQVIVVSGDPLDAAAQAAQAPDAVAALTILWPGHKHAEIQVLTAHPSSSRLSRRVRLRHRGGHGANQVAILAVELLHAALSRPPPAGPSLAITRAVEEAPVGREVDAAPAAPSKPAGAAGPTIAVGGALLDAPGPVGPVFVPTLALSYGWRQRERPWLGLLRLDVAGLGTQIVLERPATRVSVHRVLSTLDLLAMYESRIGLLPFLTVGGGICAYDASAEDPADLRGPQGTHLVFLASAGAGVFWPVWGRLGVWLEGRALMAVPSPDLGTSATNVPLLGRPSMMLSLAVGAALSANN
jgi:hypothetical protein